MALDLGVTLLLLSLIWLLTVVLAFVSARIPAGSTRKFIGIMVFMLLLLGLAIVLAADHWYFDLI